MFKIQLLTIVAVLFAFSKILYILLAKFGASNYGWILLAPIFIFCLGFYLRLSESSSLVDLGYFLTEVSSLFLSVLFAAFLLLGQIKYWKREN